MGEEGEERGSPTILLTMRRPTWSFHLRQWVTERNQMVLTHSKFESKVEEQHVPESSNHPLYLMKAVQFQES